MNQPTLEWAEFTLKPGVDEAALLQASKAFQADFLAKQPGFLRRELVAGDGAYADVVLWESDAAMERAMREVATSPACATYFAIMADNGSDPAAGVRHYRAIGRY